MSDTQTVADSVTFGLEYDGPALAQHEMDVRDLAPALLSAADLFQEVNRQVNPTAPDVAVNVRATSEGSFLIDLRIIYEATKQATLSPDVQFGVLLTGLVASVVTIIDFFKKRRVSPVLNEEPMDAGMIRVHFADGTTLEIPASVLAATRQVTVQRDLAEVVKPLDRDGITTLSIKRDTQVLTTINQSERGAFEPRTADGQDILSINEREVFLTILTAGFESGRWRFSDGASTFTARLLDQDFLDRVDSGESFSKLDVLRCSIRETQSRDSQGRLHGTVEVLRVIEHLPPAQQTLSLDAG